MLSCASGDKVSCLCEDSVYSELMGSRKDRSQMPVQSSPVFLVQALKFQINECLWGRAYRLVNRQYYHEQGYCFQAPVHFTEGELHFIIP